MTAPASFVAVVGNNDSSWRVTIPATALGAKIIRIPIQHAQSQALNPNLDGDFRWILKADGDVHYPDIEGDTVVWTRPDTIRLQHAVEMWDQGKRIVCEVDDNYLAHPKHNPTMRMHYGKQTHREIINTYAQFEHIIVTTPRLRDIYAKAFRRAGHRQPEFHICGNHISDDMWMEPEPYDGPVRVGWMGSSSHWRDIRLIYPALKAAAEMGCVVNIIGHDPHWWPQCGTKHGTKGEAGKPYGFEYNYIPWVDPAQWDRKPFPLDIALCPLERNEFTLGKSDVKVLDYALSGAAVICSDSVYGDTIVHGETGLLARKRQLNSQQQELHDCVVALVGNEKVRRELAANLREYVWNERRINLPQNIEPWRQAVGVE